MKNPMAMIIYTATSWAPSSQFDSPSVATLSAMRTEAKSAINSNSFNMMLIGVNKRLIKIRIGATNNIIFVLFLSI